MVAAGTPGPSNALLTSTGANVGVLRGLPTLLGVAVGMGLMMFVVAFGLGSVILDNPIVLTGVKWCGAAVLCWLAWKIATASRPSAAASGKPIGLFGAADVRTGVCAELLSVARVRRRLAALPALRARLAHFQRRHGSAARRVGDPLYPLDPDPRAAGNITAAARTSRARASRQWSAMLRRGRWRTL